MTHDTFNLIRRDDGALLLLMFKNDYSKENVFFKISSKDKKLKIIYPENKNIIFNEISNNILRRIKSKNKILVTEIFEDNNFSNGELSSTYYMKRA